MNVKSIALIASMLCVVCRVFAQAPVQVTYEADETNFANPERGIYHHKEVRSVAYVNLSRTELLRYRSKGSTLIMRVFYLESFVGSDISAEYLDNMRRDFAIARETGMKLLVRFAYTQKTTKPVGDAEPAWVLNHIEQLKDVLRENGDVIALVQAGFIGAWGEWYYTDHFSQVIGFINEQNWLDRIAVVNALLDATPSDRTVQLRMPTYKRRVTGVTEALTEADAFTGSARSRLGHHNDCFLASSNDVGTYVNVEEEKNYIENETRFVPLGGETCGVYVPRSECPGAVAEMQRLHWSYLNVDYHPTVINGFANGGCMPDIEKYLGYRFRLTNGEFQSNSAPSGALKISLELANDGWANPYNPRYVEFVLRNTITGKEYFFRTEEDPRRWPMDDVIRIENTIGLPANMEEGTYTLLFNLPDPRTSLYGNPDFSIRVANQQLWEEATGYNSLKVSVDIDNDYVAPGYVGDDFFVPRNVVNASLHPSPLLASASATKVLLYWGVAEDDCARVLQRAVDGGSFETIAILEGDQMYYFDEAVTPNTNYQYRYYLKQDNAISSSIAPVNISTDIENPDFRNFISDGEVEEWKVVSPVATRFSNGGTLSLRLFADRESLNVLLEGISDEDYTVYLNTDENDLTGVIDATWLNSGFDYMIKDGSLFEAQGQSWSMVSTATSVLGESGLEVSVPLSPFANSGENIRIKTAAVVKVGATSVQLPFKDHHTATYVRILPAKTPTSLKVSNSEATPQSRLVIEWKSDCIQCKGIVLERSENSEMGFSEIFRTSSAMLYRNDNLEVNKTYYYRVYAFNETGRSDYSPVTSGTTHSTITSIESIERATKVYPVPVEDAVTVQTEERLHAITVRDALGHLIYAGELERDDANRARVNLSKLSPGIYILWIHAGDHQFPYKILKK